TPSILAEPVRSGCASSSFRSLTNTAPELSFCSNAILASCCWRTVIDAGHAPKTRIVSLMKASIIYPRGERRRRGIPKGRGARGRRAFPPIGLFGDGGGRLNGFAAASRFAAAGVMPPRLAFALRNLRIKLIGWFLSWVAEFIGCSQRLHVACH